MTYAKVEMRPPKMADFAPALDEANRLIAAAKAGKWKNEAFLNAVVTMEVLAWFFIGEIIGRRSIIGYSRVPGCYIKGH
ncbi:ATP synthase subunit g [Fasciolopsis buskii]|uniref:ATP synthase subunit g n=1 Tax=Fasciolopsis buskii TaxID=27845 RepID=A0A8E0S8N3_9TREM|nr:ATP synthase subunit g [Fasciolopsis buski]